MDDRTHVRVQRMGMLDGYPWWNKDRRCDPYWRLYSNGRSGGMLWHAGRKIALEPGTAVLVPAWCVFGTEILRPRTDHFFVHFEILNLSRPLTESWFPHPILIRSPSCVAAVCSARSALQSGKGTSLLLCAKSAVYACLAGALEALPEEVQARWGDLVHGANPLARAMRFIEDHLAESVTVEEIASRCFRGKDQFTRLFRKAFGQSPHRYLMDRRIAAAAQLLAFGGEGLETVAERCGFTDRAHLSRLFRRQFGVSPAAYRKGRERDAMKTSLSRTEVAQ